KTFETEHSYIIAKNGRIVVHPDESIINHHILEINDHITGKEEDFNFSFKQEKRKSYYSTIPHLGWILVTSINPWEIKLPIILHLITFLVIVIVISLLVGVIANRVFYKRFAKPLIDLNRKVEAITSGQLYEKTPYQYSNYETAKIAKNIEKLAKEALHKSEEKYSLIANNMADTITIWDLQLNITFASPSIYRLLGITAEEAINKSITEILTPESFKIASDTLAEELIVESLGTADPDRYRILELQQYKKDGSVIWVENRMSFTRNKDNKAIGILIVSIDISERKKTEESLNEAKRQAENANIAKSQFLAGMSHEIRTPLNAILGMTDLSLMTDDKDLIKEYLSIVKQSGNHLLKILNDILDLSKIETSNLSLENREFPLIHIFASINSLFRMDIEKKGINFIINTSANLPSHIIGDEVRIKQMLINLVSNASKFTKSGTITLEAETILDNSFPGLTPLKISITDTGCGIAPEKHELIFSKFQQAEMSTTRKHGGSGLGLSIVRELATLMNGTITVESEPGKGSKFTLVIFVKVPHYSIEIPNADPDDLSKDDSLPYLKILLAEDDEINIKLATTILKRLGHTVTIARNGIEVIEILKNSTFDIVIMDIEMPEMDGIEATMQIREGICGHEKSDIPIIAITAHAVSDIKQKGLKAGMNDYISKPIDITQINKKIMAVVNKK
ncbi:MAG: ATP-binding protein, partial [Spirochaetota bacterium]